MIIFDLDGTLYRTHETTLQAFRDLCAERSVPITDEDGRELLYTTTDTVLRRVAPDMTASQRAEFVQELRRREILAVHERGRLFDGIAELLASLSADGVMLAVCGLGHKEYVEAVLERCGIRQKFRYVYARIDGVPKSDRLKALLTEAGAAPSECVMVGDSITDLTAARDCGVPFVGVGYGYGRAEIDDGRALAEDAAELQAEIYRNLVYARILRGIAGLPRPVIVGVNGIDASGKTVLAGGFSRYLQELGYNVQLVHVDDFHNPVEIRRRDDSAHGYIKYAYNLDALVGVLRGIKDTPGDHIAIVEGVHLYRPPIDGLIDYRVFIDVSFDECLRRAEVRDAELLGDSLQSRYETRYIPAQRMYFETHHPKERSDIVIDNNDYMKSVVISAP